MSLVNVQDAEWRGRKINLMSVLRSFISQLRPGQDLTKISLPAELCHPFTMLEVIGFRELTTTHTLFGVNQFEKDPLERFLSVLKFFLSTIRQESFDKKPFNPVLGESHLAWVANEEQDGVTEFVGEQVSHHPPISAFLVKNNKHQVEIAGNISFTVRFGSNQVAVATAGAEFVTLKKFNETYELTKCLPDMVVRNVIWGTKYCMWEGDITLSCPATGYTATLNFTEKKKENILSGEISHVDKDEVIYEIKGLCGAPIFIANPNQADSKRLLIDVSKEKYANVAYLPQQQLDSLASVSVWAKVYQAIVDNDIALADKEKKVVEQEQRDRSKAKEATGKQFNGTFFDMDGQGHWAFKNNVSLSKYLENPTAYNFPNSEIRQAAQSAPASASASPAPTPAVTSASTPATPATTPAVSATPAIAGTAPHSAAGPAAPPSPSLPNGDSKETELSPKKDSTTTLPTPKKKIRSSSISIAETPIHEDGDSNYDEIAGTLSEGDETRGRGLGPDSDTDRDLSPPPAGTQSEGITPIPTRGRPKPNSSSLTPGSLPSRTSKTQLKDEKKKLREEQKYVYQKVKLEKKKNSEVFTQSTAMKTIASGNVKLRNSLKKWSPKWVILQPGRLIYFKNKSDVARDSCSGILNLTGCEVKPRPSKKDGFCFKIFHVAQYPIYAKQGLKGETLKKALLPVGADYCILRVNDEKEGEKWIETIRSAIPDYDKIKSLQHVAEPDTDSDEDEYEDDITLDTADDHLTISTPSVKVSADHKDEVSLSSSASSVSVAAASAATGTQPTGDKKDKSAPQYQIKDVFKQMGYLYKTTRKLHASHTKLAAAVEELKKSTNEGLEDVKKQNAALLFQVKQSANKPAAPAAKASHSGEAKPWSPMAYLQHIKENPVAVVQLAFYLVLIYVFLSLSSNLNAAMANMSSANPPETSPELPNPSEL